MFSSIGWPEIMVIVLIGLFIFGPEKVPQLISDAVKMIRQLRRMATNATSDLSRELGTEITIEDLNPKAFVRKHLLSDDEQESLIRPFRETYQEVTTAVRDIDPTADDTSIPAATPAAGLPRRQRFEDAT